MFRAGVTSMRNSDTFLVFAIRGWFIVSPGHGKICFYNISAESYITTCNNAEKDGLSGQFYFKQ